MRSLKKRKFDQNQHSRCFSLKNLFKSLLGEKIHQVEKQISIVKMHFSLFKNRL